MLCEHIERRVLAAMIVNAHGELEAAAGLELDDVPHFHHQVILKAIRQLQEANAPVNALSVCDEIAMGAMDRDNQTASHVDAVFLGIMLCDTWRHPHPVCFAADVRHLRIIAKANRV